MRFLFVMVIVPNQPFGIGDVIFCQTLVRKIADGLPIVWPVLPHFVDGLNRAYPDIKFINSKTSGFDFERRDQFSGIHAEYGAYTQLPLRWADVLLGVPYNDCMKAKYQLYGLDFEIWRDCAMWARDGIKEHDLWIKECVNQGIHLDFTGDERNASDEYTFVNYIFGSEGVFRKIIPDKGKQLSMRIIDGYSLFDWMGTIQHATAIHTVNTSIIYLLEMLDLKAPEVHLYQRTIKGQTFDNIKYILKRHKYVLHE